MRVIKRIPVDCREGWKWKSFTKAEHPLFWRKKGDNYQLRLVFEEIDMPWNWPVEVNYLEAKAFCNWKTEKTGLPIRLMTEEEWYILHDGANIPDLPEWETAPGNINLEHYQSPCPVDLFKSGDFYDLIGNVWQWTETTISSYEGFKIHPSYDDFRPPTFDTRHNMIKGGSWISTGNEAIRASRYAFRRHFINMPGLGMSLLTRKLSLKTTTTKLIRKLSFIANRTMEPPRWVFPTFRRPSRISAQILNFPISRDARWIWAAKQAGPPGSWPAPSTM